MAITFDLTSNAVVNDGQTASFEVSNIQGVPVSGCPIGKTFYENMESGTFVGYIGPLPTLFAGSKIVFSFETLRNQSDYYIFEQAYPFVFYRNDKIQIYNGSNWLYSDSHPEWNNTTELKSIEITAVISDDGTTADIGISLTCNGVSDSISRTIPITSDGYDIRTTSNPYVTVVKQYLVGQGLPNDCTGEVADATIEYFRNGVLDYTGNPWSFSADGSMDGDSIVARVSSETGRTVLYEGVGGSAFDPSKFNKPITTSPDGSISVPYENLTMSFLFTGNDIDSATWKFTGNYSGENLYYAGFFDFGFSGSSGVRGGIVTNVNGLSIRDANLRWDSPFYPQWVGVDLSIEIKLSRTSINEITMDISVSGGGVAWDFTYIYTNSNTGNVTTMLIWGAGAAHINKCILESVYIVAESGLPLPEYDFTDSDPVIMSVLHYTSEPPSPQNLTEGDPLGFDWDIAGANPVGSVTDYTVNKNGVPLVTDSTTDTTISYSIPSVALGDAGNYDLTITNGGRDPFLSDPVVVNVGSGIYDPFNTITKGAKSVNTYTFYGCSTEIALGMDRNVDSRGFVQWLDNGKEYDNYYSEYSLDTENGKALEEILTDDTINVATISTPFVNGFYPFSPLFATNQDYSVYFSDGWKGLGDLDVNGLHRKYTLTIVPAVQDIYSSYTLNGVVSQGCIVDNWQINGVPFPFSEWSQDLNNLSRVVTLGGNASEIVDTKREYGDVVKLNLNCGEEQARQILYFITHVMRGTVQTATFPDVYNIFGRRYEGLTSCKVKLHSDILKVTHQNYHEVTIELELQMVGV